MREMLKVRTTADVNAHARLFATEYLLSEDGQRDVQDMLRENPEMRQKAAEESVYWGADREICHLLWPIMHANREKAQRVKMFFFLLALALAVRGLIEVTS